MLYVLAFVDVFVKNASPKGKAPKNCKKKRRQKILTEKFLSCEISGTQNCNERRHFSALETPQKGPQGNRIGAPTRDTHLLVELFVRHFDSFENTQFYSFCRTFHHTPHQIAHLCATHSVHGHPESHPSVSLG